MALFRRAQCRGQRSPKNAVRISPAITGRLQQKGCLKYAVIGMADGFYTEIFGNVIG